MNCAVIGVHHVRCYACLSRCSINNIQNGVLACGGRWKGIVIADRVVLALRLQYPDLNLQVQLLCLPCAELCLHGTSIRSCVHCFCLDSLGIRRMFTDLMKPEDQCAMKPQKKVPATVTGGVYCLSFFHGLVNICCEFLVQVRE